MKHQLMVPINSFAVLRLLKFQNKTVASLDDLEDFPYTSAQIARAVNNHRMTSKMIEIFCKYFGINEREIY